MNASFLAISTPLTYHSSQTNGTVEPSGTSIAAGKDYIALPTTLLTMDTYERQSDNHDALRR